MKTKEVLLRKKILGFSILFHISLIVLAMTTYYTIDNVNDAVIEDQITYMEIKFSNSSKSSGMASTQKNLNKPPRENITSRAIEEKIVQVEPLVELENEMIIEEFEKIENTETKVKEVSGSEIDGESDFGEMITGAALGKMDLDGEGVFGRKVIFHAPIKKIAEQDGKIAINLGINRAGHVIGAAINKDYSTIADRGLLIKALEMALKYRFEKDYTAPVVQYGKFTFIFDLRV